MSKRILLADDSLTIQKVVELTFMDEDFEVEAVGSGDEAISRLGGDLPNIVIADVHMPGASGYEVCRQAKGMSANLPVLLLVGTFEALDENEITACGADGNLKKPFDSQELLQVVRRMTSGAPPVRAEAPAAEQIEGFEGTTHEAAFGDGAVDLPVTGFDLGAGGLVEESSVTSPEPAFAGFEANLVDLEGEPELAPVDLGVDPGADPGAGAAWRDAEPMDAAGTSEQEDSDTYGSGNETVLLDSDPPPPAVDEADDSEVFGSSVAAASASVTAGSDESEQASEDGSPEVVGLSDLDVDRVARRVVELMSDDAVREVAWDVIPDMAEIVIKARVRELEAEAD